MGTYVPGDVLLARVRLRGQSDPKTRPVVVLATRPGGILEVSPVTSRPPADALSLPLAPADFDEGGLDICDESYLLVRITVVVKASEIIGKKGRVGSEALAEVYRLRER
jgi:hypothetical protein